MGNLKIYPGKLSGEVKIPPSKSMAHRAVICAALGDGVSKVTNIDYSDDIIATIEAMRALGAKITKKEDYLEVYGVNSPENIEANSVKEQRTIDCNESGSTLRFLVPIAALFDGVNRFVGRGNLGKRPLDTYYKIFDEQGIKYSYKDGILDLKTEGKLKAGEFKMQGNISSQFITGLLFTLPLLDGDSKIIITTEMESKGYIDLTLSAIKDFGVEIINNNYEEFIIKGNQSYKSIDYRVEGDYSQAAFFFCADALSSNIVLNDLKLDSLQGDKEVIDILQRMGLKLNNKDNGLIGSASLGLKSTIIDGSQCPDIIPVVSLVAALSEGTTEIINAGRLRIKECDRLAAVTSELNKLGAKIIEKEEGLIIEGVKELKGNVEVWSHKDHRIAMTMAIASIMCKEPIILKDYECVSKSYPQFWDDFKNLGGVFDEWNVGE
ncbi:MAG: 3-phosphoshikimate 1-carboxyvinyltransferase [Clostridium beijerinckii]|jgi:3-phosphoshikimate 1-carboxyvinyltransferase|uniref:3-phosphoshikimate 1-carboxyvinyltransferase n=1 Tax=Clostridium beijerinckii TaxID=1520 RepID=UPI0024321DF4|nr:3-phosphoshikimate 1-carboxyvinyltransferase [Clostridium beijerinckii]MCI1476933.1 3-phosphoshikimate 1-carboxyvinyltransferase [Clostridium beijerinckii]MCI1578289.1 3-phosphoshikimate 1-carboxyvinyltransferase [Clostridium beijerinckii]MCI1582529.1 3-phosphoshikimate 1-carboxyvinyltransferase [Clostridium beijerinckii]MCI1621488.1 3-phosphoshikimate 1-carboxyvinyltransferase [Clostridium beijerinckii]MDG5853275.1 3-phosphoshikimate 1-carboxyvinyltransferase [Clostridium beijerinckii]